MIFSTFDLRHSLRLRWRTPPLLLARIVAGRCPSWGQSAAQPATDWPPSGEWSGSCADCGQPACKLLVGGAGQPDTILCERCEYRRYLAATGGRDYANEQRVRWGLPPIPRLELDTQAPER